MVNFFFTKYVANDFSEPPRRADSKNPTFVFGRFLGLGHLQGPGVNLGRILGSRQLSPFWGRAGGLLPGGSIDPRPTQLKAPPPKFSLLVCVLTCVPRGNPIENPMQATKLQKPQSLHIANLPFAISLVTHNPRANAFVTLWALFRRSDHPQSS